MSKRNGGPKMWVLAQDYGYEGWGAPVAAYSVKEMALSEARRRGGYAVHEVPLDALGRKPVGGEEVNA